MKMIVYTDGSFKPNVEADPTLGSYGSGIHGYVYDETKESKAVTDSPNNFYITSIGYVSSTEYNPDIHVAVAPVCYIDASYSFLNKGTVNMAELLAILHALKGVLEHRAEFETEESKLNEVLILADSSYAIIEFDRMLGYKSVDDYVANFIEEDKINKDILVEMKETIDKIKGAFNNNITLSIDKVAAHSLHIGNDIADDLAYLGRELSGKHKLFAAYKIFKIEKGKKYWSYTIEEYDMIKFRQLFFTNSLRACYSEVVYSVMNYRADTEPGTRSHDALMGIVCLKHSPDIVEDAIEEYHKGLRNMSTLSVVNMKNLYSRDVAYYYNMFKKDLFTFIYKRKELLKRNILVVNAIGSPGLGQKMLNDMQFMYEFIRMYRDLKSKGKPITDTLLNKTIRYINITDKFYGKDKKGKQVCILQQGSTFLVMDMEWDNSPLKFPLSLGRDTLERNQFKRLETTDIEVYLIVEKMAEKSYRYYTLVASDGNIGVYTNLYSNKIITE